MLPVGFPELPDIIPDITGAAIAANPVFPDMPPLKHEIGDIKYIAVHFFFGYISLITT